MSQFRPKLITSMFILIILFIKLVIINKIYQIPFRDDLSFTIGMVLLIFLMPIYALISYQFIKYKYSRTYFLDRYTMNIISISIGILILCVVMAILIIYAQFQMIFMLTVLISMFAYSITVINQINAEYKEEIRKENRITHLENIKKFRLEEVDYERKESN